MIFSLLAVIGGIAAAIGTLIYWVREGLDYLGVISGIVVGVFFGAIAGIAVFASVVLADWGLSNLTHPETVYQHVPIVNLQDSTQTTGDFFLGFGTLDGTPTYGFYTDKNGAYQFNTADASGVNVYQDSDKPYAVQNTDCKMRNWSWLLDCVDWNEGNYVTFHVPKGSVKSGYNLDARN